MHTSGRRSGTDDIQYPVHAWNYRRYILANLPSSSTKKQTPQDELRYTQKKIEANFSNFSAWHCRTKILGEVWEAMEEDEVEKAKSEGGSSRDRMEMCTDWVAQSSSWLGRRCGLIRAINQGGYIIVGWLAVVRQIIQSIQVSDRESDPPEQSLRREVDSIRELHETEPDSKCGSPFPSVVIPNDGSLHELTIAGCMNALALYALKLSRITTALPDQSLPLRNEARQLFERLEEVDPDRKERYRDQGQSSGPSWSHLC